MSIMQAEAEQAASRIYLTAHDPLSSLQEAYRAGRTAEPTDAEIEAALPELKAAYRQESDLVTDRDYVKRILEAAREAVTE